MGISEREFAQLNDNLQRAKLQSAKVARAPKASKSHKPNKFNAVKTDGSDSGKESKRLRELRILHASGEIQNLVPQVTFLLIPPQVGPTRKKERSMTYTCDAMYVQRGKLIVEDSKSPPTRALPAYIIKRKLMLEKYGIAVLET